MESLENLESLVANQTASISYQWFVINFLIAAALSYILSLIYVRYSSTVSNRSNFSRNFILLTITTMFIITIVKSSLALSLGLVGALSIVRFRAAIKEPEELSYLFIAIAIGLGLGANQTIITVIAFFCITVVIAIKGKVPQGDVASEGIYLQVNTNKAISDKIVSIVTMHSRKMGISRLDINESGVDALFTGQFISYEDYKDCRDELIALDKDIHITLLDNRGIVQ